MNYFRRQKQRPRLDFFDLEGRDRCGQVLAAPPTASYSASYGPDQLSAALRAGERPGPQRIAIIFEERVCAEERRL